jgi:hypothetical protein
MNPAKPALAAAATAALVLLGALAAGAYWLLRAPETPAAAAGALIPDADPALARPDGLEAWALVDRIRLPAGSGATALGAGPGTLAAMGERELLLYPLPNLAPHVWVPLGFRPSAMAIGPDGRVFLAAGSRIHRLDTVGRPDGGWDLPEDSPPIASLAAGEDRVWVASGQLRAVLAYDADGQSLGSLEARPGEEFVVPGAQFALAAGAAGPIAANPGRRGLQYFSRFGQQLDAWYRPGTDWDRFQGCCNPIAIACLPRDGGELVASAEKGAARVKLSDRTGRLVAVLEGPADYGPGVKDIGLAADSSGRVYVLDAGRQEIRAYARKVD